MPRSAAASRRGIRHLGSTGLTGTLLAHSGSARHQRLPNIWFVVLLSNVFAGVDCGSPEDESHSSRAGTRTRGRHGQGSGLQAKTFTNGQTRSSEERRLDCVEVRHAVVDGRPPGARPLPVRRPAGTFAGTDPRTWAGTGRVKVPGLRIDRVVGSGRADIGAYRPYRPVGSARCPGKGSWSRSRNHFLWRSLR